MRVLVVITALIGAAIATSPRVCSEYEDCVHKNQCDEYGNIKTDGGGGLDLRNYGPTGDPQCTDPEFVCCTKPGATPPPIYDQCHVTEECVDIDICRDGVIITDGAGLIDPRIYQNRICGKKKVCCRHPDNPPPVDYCLGNAVCTDYDYCSVDGNVINTLVEPAPGGPVYNGPVCYMNPGGDDPTTGVCCTTVRSVDPCPLGEQCTANHYCDSYGHISAAEVPIGSQYSGQDCYIGFSLNIGVCCKPVAEPPVTEPPLVPCPPGGICTPHNYCGADGHLTPTAHSGPTCTDCQACPIGVDTYTEGVCCGPPKPQGCSGGNECTPPEYCDDKGYVVSKPSTTPYSNGQECSLDGGYGGYGVCCNPTRPVGYCPLDSTCVLEQFCYGSILEADGEDVWSNYETPKPWFSCEHPGQAGVCCKTTKNERQCGKSYYANQKVDTRFYEPALDKLEADFGEFPWQAIVFFSNYTFKCGASLISDRHLLTVAHCVNGIYASDLKIRLGDWQVNSFDEPLPYQDVDVSAVYIHPEFVSKNVWNNIAILELKQRVNYEYNINDICLPGAGGYQFAPGTRCVVAGWGKDSFAGTYQQILKKIEVPLVENGQCQNLFRNTRLGKYFRLHESYLCAGGEEGIDACTGDGGGPLICLDEQAGTYTQVGITAWGIGCGNKDVPGAYTDVAKFVPWIDSIVSRPPGAGPYEPPAH